MIKAVMVISTTGKPRFSKFYESQSPEKQQEFIRQVYAVLSNRPGDVSNFVQGIGSVFGSDTQLVYKHYATLYFVLLFDNSENELAMLDLIQVLVETLDRCFKNVCELDIVFNYSKMHAILDEIILGGQVQGTDSFELMKAVEEITKLESASTASKIVAKSVSSWWAR
ncbi:PREDICTED: AP-3 complex subunit sigma-like [Ipomoea nil]|uniref:AP-3 complex subunit sigma-like n=1 Tax=Ipomoea nil TaxID=35883 RepID=UPI0009010BE0|nr:PREDICTED: AP-3 complex subunit sigma-like [Ipomoea nil]